MRGGGPTQGLCGKNKKMYKTALTVHDLFGNFVFCLKVFASLNSHRCVSFGWVLQALAVVGLLGQPKSQLTPAEAPTPAPQRWWGVTRSCRTEPERTCCLWSAWAALAVCCWVFPAPPAPFPLGAFCIAWKTQPPGPSGELVSLWASSEVEQNVL